MLFNNSHGIRQVLFILAFCCFWLLSAAASREARAVEQFSAQRIEELVKPIALYPDSLLQSVLAASTFSDQIADAALLIRDKSDAELIKDQEWDVSVKVLATYPGILKRMYEKLDWTTELGQAFLAQNADVLNAIQKLRKKAQSLGNLKSGETQKVSEQEADGTSVIVIEPSDPEVIYVPQETSTVVYSEPGYSTSAWAPVATLGLGLALGAAINNDDDHYYGGPWGSAMWSRNESFERWVDERHDTMNQALDQRHERLTSRQDFRQDQRSSRQDFRQEHAGERGQFTRSNPPANRQQAQQNVQARRDQARSNAPASTQQARQNAQARGSQARAQYNENRSGTVSQRGSDISSRRQTASSSWSGQGGRSYANRTSSRGTMSMSSAGRSGGFRGGGGGGGGFRGGGRGGGGRR